VNIVGCNTSSNASAVSMKVFGTEDTEFCVEILD
jgi:hypothetical protein